jgi:hypothetical protein
MRYIPYGFEFKAGVVGVQGSIGVIQKAFTALADFYQSSGGTKTTAFASIDFLS